MKNKKVLITAGPTWVPIDKVRVISNIASAKTGILLAELARELRADVTLILGPVGEDYLGSSIKVKRFYYFDELHSLVKKELRENKYDIVIHSAAVSDFKTKKVFSEKIKSDSKNLTLDLESTIKIVDKIKKYSPRVFLVIFKLEFKLSKSKMIESARRTMRESGADLAVVNTFSNRYPYKALIIDRDKIFYETNSKEDLTKRLLRLVSLKIN
ncbi:phosphopantothenoylcysteine decarboxylase [bacterium]|nr:phosphopantothenoylcysteine decarboxylase [bacterium]